MATRQEAREHIIDLILNFIVTYAEDAEGGGIDLSSYFNLEVRWAIENIFSVSIELINKGLWLVSKNIIDAMYAIKPPFNVNSVAQLAAVAALTALTALTAFVVFAVPAVKAWPNRVPVNAVAIIELALIVPEDVIFPNNIPGVSILLCI